MVRQDEKYRKGAEGERIVSEILSNLPQEDYCVLNDLMLIDEDENSNMPFYQIDHVVVSRFGIFVIETKNWKGYIRGFGSWGNWKTFLGKKVFKTYNAVLAIRNKANNLQKVLFGNEDIQCVYPIVVFVQNNRLNISELKVKKDVRLCFSDNLNDYILNKKKTFMMSDEKINAALQYLLQCNVTDPEIRNYHDDYVRHNQKRRNSQNYFKVQDKTEDNF